MLEVKAGTLDQGFPPITDRSSPENPRILEASQYLAKKIFIKGQQTNTRERLEHDRFIPKELWRIFYSKALVDFFHL